MVASALVARIPADIRLFNLFPGFTRGQAVISGSGCAVLAPDFMPAPIDDIGVTMC